MSELAIFGGKKTKTTPFGSGRRFDGQELAYLKEALDQNTLFYWFGEKTKELCYRFAEYAGTEHAVAATSGTAAIHVALGAAGVTEGDEVVTSPITDMGSVIGILYQNAVPVFADLDPRTYNMTAESIEKVLTPRTKAVVLVHLAGNPADLDPIVQLCRERGIALIEDCAQSYGCIYKGKKAGSFGDFGCFSVNDFKHISAGDGGVVVMNGQERYETAFAFADKNYNRLAKSVAAGIQTLAPNYRMNELTAAVALAQLEKVDWITERRRQFGDALTEAISELPGILPPVVQQDCASSYWFYMLRIDETLARVSRDDFAAALNAEGIPAQAGYIPTVVYQYPLFRSRTAYPGTHFPFDNPVYGEGGIFYREGDCPVAEEILRTAIKLPVNEYYNEQDLHDMSTAIRKVAEYYAAR